MESRNLPTERLDVAARLMAATASASQRIQQPVFHLSISFSPGDPASREMMARVADTVLRDLELSEHQAVLVAHGDTANPHFHLAVNRMHPETGVAWGGSWSKARVEKSLRRQEVELGLRVVPGRLARVPGEQERRLPQPRLERGDAAFLQAVAEIRDKAAEFRDEFGDEARARALEWAATRLDAALDEWSNQQLTLAEAARESGYSSAHLGRSIRLGRIPNAGRPNAPRVRRADVPQKPGALRPRPLTLMVDRTQIASSVVNSSRDHDG